MKEENSKLVLTFIVIVFLIFFIYLGAVVVAVVENMSIATVIHNWQSWALDFLRNLIKAS